MLEEFEPTQYDPYIAHVSFAEENGQFRMEIQAVSKEQAIMLEENILAARRIYDMAPPKNVEFPIKQNFEVECIEEQAKVKISGNIFNAFKLLTERKLITPSLAETILASDKTKAFLDSTKNFIIEVGSSEEMEESPRTAMERAAALRKEYLAVLMELQPDELKQSVVTFAEELAANGKDLLEVKTQDSRNNSPKVH